MEFDQILQLPWREAMAILEKDAPTNCTWMKVSSFIKNTYSQEQIIQVNVFFWKFFDSLHINENPDDYKEKEYDDLCGAVEPWWYAMEDTDAFDKALQPFLREDEKNAIG